MSFSIPTPDNLKSKAKVARQFLKEKCGADLSHSQSIELLSQLFGFKDWNTAKAELSNFDRLKALASMRSEKSEDSSPVEGMTVGEVRKALEGYDDETTMDADFAFILGDFINSIDDMDSPENTIHQEFAVTAIEKVDSNYVSLKLKLNYESMS